MSATLPMAAGLRVPLEWVTATCGILAQRGAGKSSTAVSIAEHMHEARLPFVAIDPKGDWWGLRADGPGLRGLEIPIFGGEHADVAVSHDGGAELADVIVELGLTAVVDVSGFEHDSHRFRFLADFGRRLYHRKLKARTPLHLFLDEAHDYLPQQPSKEQWKTVHAWQTIVKMGRQRGIGASLVTQRSAAINKGVLSQVETLIVLRTSSPWDRKAIEDWLKHQGARAEIMESLPRLANGEGWVISPGFLGLAGPKRVQFPLRRTFDSGATPRVGEKRPAPPALSEIDLGGLQTRMASAVEAAAAEDPKKLRSRIAELEREVAKKPAPVVAPEPEVRVERFEVPVVDEATRRAIVDAGELVRGVEGAISSVETALAAAGQAWNRIAEALKRVDERPREQLVSRPDGLYRGGKRGDFVRTLPSRSSSMRAAVQSAPRSNGAPEGLSKGQRATLTAIAQHRDGVTSEQLTILTGYKRSTRDSYLQRLRTAELIGRDDDRHIVTVPGLEALGPDFEPLPTGDALREHWLGRLGGGEQAVLEAVCRAYPRAVARDTLGESLGYARSSRDSYLQRLGARRLIVSVGPGEVRASEELFG